MLTPSLVALCAGGLLSKDSPFLDIILEGVKLRLPSAEIAYPRVEPALGAALLVRLVVDTLFTM